VALDQGGEVVDSRTEVPHAERLYGTNQTMSQHGARIRLNGGPFANRHFEQPEGNHRIEVCLATPSTYARYLHREDQAEPTGWSYDYVDSTDAPDPYSIVELAPE
jgi:hypothetical protein